MNAAFLSQWQFFRRGVARPPLVGLAPKTDSAFDPGVKVGDVRVFADTNRPLVALIVDDRRLSGWRIVPVSPFCAPASARELMVGERVFQLWNTTVVARRFASRSWRVDELEGRDVDEVRGAIAAANPGRLTAGDGVQAKYEREFLVGEGSLVPFVAPRAAESSRVVWLSPALKIAASFALCLAAWYVLMMDTGRRIVRNWRDSFRAVDIVQEKDAVIELLDAREPDEPQGEIAEVDIDFMPSSATWQGKGVTVPSVFGLAKFPDVRGPKIPGEIKKFTLNRDRFVSPISAPMDVVFLSCDGRVADGASSGLAGNSAFAYAAAAEPLESPPNVTCDLVDDSRSCFRVAKILRIGGDAAAGAKITVVFDSDIVEAYHKVVDAAPAGKVNVHYELEGFAGGKEITSEAVFVTLIWPSKGGDVRTPLIPTTQDSHRFLRRIHDSP